MSLVQSVDEVLSNAFAFVDALKDSGEFREEALHLTSAGRVYYPFRNGERLSFAPAKFIGYSNNDFGTYYEEAGDRNGGRARSAVTKVLGFEAEENKNLERQLENYCGSLGIPLHQNRHSFWLTKEAIRGASNDRSAINDLENYEYGNDDPEYLKRITGEYVRDQRVRIQVLSRANGNCEYCGKKGFVSRVGRPFLEAHHVIALSEQGPDKMSNVIALCPNDHREAHFGERWEKMQAEFQDILKKKTKK
ncbi:MAG: HNH endonuclease signature motif containing protein [Parasphingorhabdus sp.]